MKKAVVGFPKFLLGLTLGLIIAILTQIDVFLFAVIGILAALIWDSALVGAFVALVPYTLSYIVSQWIGQILSVINRNSALFLNVMDEHDGREFTVD